MVILCQQNLKNIMQVRNNLQSKKRQSQKPRKVNQVSRKSKQNKRVKTVNLQQSASKSKSKSNGSKENIKNKKYHSKSKQKVSPIKIKSIKGCNTSPIINSERTPLIKISPVKCEGRQSRNLTSHRECQKAFQTISTKINTERTPSKRITQYEPKKQQPSNKCKKSNKNRTLKTEKGMVENQKKTKINKQEKNRQKMQENAFKKSKKIVAPINTTGPQRKQSYFDQQAIERFNLDNGNYFRRKRPEYHKVDNSKKNNFSTQTNNLCSLSFREFGVETENDFVSLPSAYKDLEGLRREQEMKWRIIYLELTQLKEMRTPDKIDQIIEQSHKNISQFQVKCKQIGQLKENNNHYVIQSPIKVRDALTRRRKSSQQNRSLIKTLSDQRLLRQLQNLDNFEQNSQDAIQNDQRPSNNSFCQQFEKQLEDYSKQHKNQAPAFLNFQLEHIPELQYQKSMQIYNHVFDSLFLQLCEDMANSETILHSYLALQENQRNQNLPEQIQAVNNIDRFDELKIKCNHSYSIDLLYKLFVFLKDRNYEKIVLERVNKPLGSSPLSSLKLLRNYFVDDEEDLYEDDEAIQIIIDSDVLAEFQSEKLYYAIEGQYYYNHCVYSCLNEILDTIRPFGLHGPPPLQYNVAPIHKNMDKIFNKVHEKITQILKIQMGRQDFDEAEVDPLKVAQKSYGLMDNFLIQQQEQKWKKMQQNVFEEKYFLAQSIISQILNDEIMIIYNEFL